MKNIQNLLMFFLALFLSLKFVYGQPTVNSIDPQNPIRSINYYFNSQKDLILEVFLNKISLKDISQTISPNDVKITKVTGEVTWSANQAIRPKELDITCFRDKSDPYRYLGVFQTSDNNGAYSLKSGEWVSVKSVTISCNVKDKSIRVPSTDIYPQIDDRSLRPPLTLDMEELKGTFENNNSRFVLGSKPRKVPFEIYSISLINDNDGIQLKDNRVSFANPLNSNNGVCIVDFQASSTLKAGTWRVEVDVLFKEAGSQIQREKFSPKVLLESQITVSDNSKDHSQDARGQKDINFTIPTTAVNGEKVGIIFIPDELVKKYTITNQSTVNNRGNIEFKVNNISNLPDDEMLYFQVSDGNGRPISNKYFKLTNQLPKLDNFKFDAVNNNVTSIKFDLPDWTEKSKLALRLSNNGISVDGTGMSITNGSSSNKKTYEIKLSDPAFNTLLTSVSASTIVNGNIVISYENKPIYQTSVRYINQTLINEKLQELVELSSQKPPKKESEKTDRLNKIKQTVNDIAGIIGKVGKAAENTEMEKIVSDLAGDNTRDSENSKKAMSAIAKIGNWVAKIAPAVIPLVL